jgi:transcriptional regulator with XRE-family HTH domain
MRYVPHRLFFCLPVCLQNIPARILSQRIVLFGALLSWRHFPGGRPPCSRSFIFQGSMSPDKNQFTEKRGLLPYVQDAGKTHENRIFPRSRKCAIMKNKKRWQGGALMYTKLSIPERLKDLRVVDKHLTLEQLAEQTGLSKSALGKYESDDYKDISPFAIATLAKFYGVSTDYLMGVSENKNHPNTELQALHLSDAMVELLSSGKINNRLLCELATHPNFLRLMVDMEIFIDQIADMRVNQMNLILEATRQTILKEHAPGENDLYMRTLELGQVQENDFYSHILHDDLDSIVRDIREAHLKDKTTADPQPTLDEVNLYCCF